MNVRVCSDVTRLHPCITTLLYTSVYVLRQNVGTTVGGPDNARIFEKKITVIKCRLYCCEISQ